MRGREIEVLQQLGNAYMLALADGMRGATRSEAVSLSNPPLKCFEILLFLVQLTTRLEQSLVDGLPL